MGDMSMILKEEVLPKNQVRIEKPTSKMAVFLDGYLC